MKSQTIGSKIITARKNKNLSQAELAKHIAISPQAVGKWERGESMPDLITLNRLADILGLDLNYFSENFESINNCSPFINNEEKIDAPSENENVKLGWNMSEMNLSNCDFSGLKELHDKFNNSNMQQCLFVGSDLMGLQLRKNNIESCDFSNSDLSKCQIQNTMMSNNSFKKCMMNETQFYKSYLTNCDLSEADLTKANFKDSYITNCKVQQTYLKETVFVDTGFQEIVFEGRITDCKFESCDFYKTVFQNVTLTKTFFKNNKKFNRVKFINCKVDELTFAFLKSNLADLNEIVLLDYNKQ